MVKLQRGVGVCNREGVYHARLRRLGTEGRRSILGRSFGPTENTSAESKKLVLDLVPC